MAGRSPKTKEEQRHYNMIRIHSKDTKPEVLLSKALWHEGIRYRKNVKSLPGKPDIAITKYKIAILCDGEFWHGKDWEIKKPRTQSNREFWLPKIERNMARDRENEKQLQDMGWRVLRFWSKDIVRNVAGCVGEVKIAVNCYSYQQ